MLWTQVKWRADEIKGGSEDRKSATKTFEMNVSDATKSVPDGKGDNSPTFQRRFNVGRGGFGLHKSRKDG